MLEKLRHFDGKVYQRLVALDSDLKSQGPVYQWLSTSLGLKDSEVTQVVRNTALATGILQDTCRAGKLRFDLDPKSFFVTGDVVAETIDCNAP
jgi:hypothetical protein